NVIDELIGAPLGTVALFPRLVAAHARRNGIHFALGEWGSAALGVHHEQRGDKLVLRHAALPHGAGETREGGVACALRDPRPGFASALALPSRLLSECEQPCGQRSERHLAGSVPNS